MRRAGLDLFSATLLLALGCGNGKRPAGPDPAGPGQADGGATSMSRAAVVEALGTCTLEVYRGVVPAADRLAETSAMLAADGSPERWTAAREAWVAAMAAWQEAEVFQYGPLAPRQASPGAEDIRDNIYAWPFVAPASSSRSW